MTATKLAGPQIWQQNLAKMIPAIYEAAVVTPSGSLFMVHGRTIEGRDGGIVAKYGTNARHRTPPMSSTAWPKPEATPKTTEALPEFGLQSHAA